MATTLKQQLEDARREIVELQATVQAQAATITDLKATNAALEARIQAQQVLKGPRPQHNACPTDMDESVWARLTPHEQRKIGAQRKALSQYGAGWKPAEYHR